MFFPPTCRRSLINKIYMVAQTQEKFTLLKKMKQKLYITSFGHLSGHNTKTSIKLKAHKNKETGRLKINILSVRPADYMLHLIAYSLPTPPFRKCRAAWLQARKSTSPWALHLSSCHSQTCNVTVFCHLFETVLDKEWVSQALLPW